MNRITCTRKELPLNETLATFPKWKYSLNDAIARYREVMKCEPETVYELPNEYDMSLPKLEVRNEHD
jgi:hypothetical protein